MSARACLFTSIVLVASALFVSPSAATAAPHGSWIQRVSVASDGVQGNGGSEGPDISGNGRFVAFSSDASNLVPGDTNGHTDVFARDRRTGTTVRVSVATDGTQGDDDSVGPVISRGGRYVAFSAWASTLVPGDTNDAVDVFVHDLSSGTTVRASVNTDGQQSEPNDFGCAVSFVWSMSPDGRYAAFDSCADNLAPGDANNYDDAYVHDMITGETTRASLTWTGEEGDFHAFEPQVSDDGRYVAFYSMASNFVPGDTNGREDVYVRDLLAGTTTRVSVSSAGGQGNDGSFDPTISADGQTVAFDSVATNLVPGDTNRWSDAFVHDLATGQTRRISVATDGTQGDNGSYRPILSSDGRFAAYYSLASTLTPADTNAAFDVFVTHLPDLRTMRASWGAGRVQGDGGSFGGPFSVGDRFLAFDSFAENLVPDDSNEAFDAFVVNLALLR